MQILERVDMCQANNRATPNRFPLLTSRAVTAVGWIFNVTLVIRGTNPPQCILGRRIFHERNELLTGTSAQIFLFRIEIVRRFGRLNFNSRTARNVVTIITVTAATSCILLHVVVECMYVVM